MTEQDKKAEEAASAYADQNQLINDPHYDGFWAGVKWERERAKKILLGLQQACSCRPGGGTCVACRTLAASGEGDE